LWYGSLAALDPVTDIALVKTSLILAITLLGVGIAAAIAMAFAPELTQRLQSGPSVKGPGSAEAAGIVLLLLIGAMALVALVTAPLAWLAARHAEASSALRWSCWLPVVLALVAALRVYRKLTAP